MFVCWDRTSVHAGLKLPYAARNDLDPRFHLLSPLMTGICHHAVLCCAGAQTRDFGYARRALYLMLRPGSGSQSFGSIQRTHLWLTWVIHIWDVGPGMRKNAKCRSHFKEHVTFWISCASSMFLLFCCSIFSMQWSPWLMSSIFLLMTHDGELLEISWLICDKGESTVGVQTALTLCSQVQTSQISLPLLTCKIF